MKEIHQEKYTPVVAILAAGFAATIGQIIFLRELLVIFYGNELSAGLIFSAWMLWTGLGSALSGKRSSRIPLNGRILGLTLAVFAALLPVSLLIIRAARIVWELPPGELPAFGKMILIIFSATGILCPISGALFGFSWAAFRSIYRETVSLKPLMIYLGEALGAACGGLLFYYILLPSCSALTSVWITCGCCLCISGWMIRPFDTSGKGKTARSVWALVCILVVGGAILGDRIEKISRRWQWGPDIHTVYDSAYHNIAILKKRNQLSVFTNGLWLIASPDKLSAERAVHLAMLQHPDPKRVLILSGGNADLPDEVLKHPNIHRIDYVEPDPDLFRLVVSNLSPEFLSFLEDPRLNIYHSDPRSFLLRNNRQYDVVLMNAGDPITAQMNRFYTEGFFETVKARLLPDGVFSFAVSGGEDILGPNQARFLGSIRKTLHRVFADVLLYPGDQTRFFASGQKALLIKDPSALAVRMQRRNLKLVYIREDYLADALNPFRLDYMNSMLEDVPETVVNKDFHPTCYFHTLMLWATQWHPAFQGFLKTVASAPVAWVWGIIAVSGIIVIMFFSAGRPKYATAVSGCILISGAIEMVLQLVLLLGFQIIEGYVYRQLALIIAFFMTGLAVGAQLVSLLGQNINRAASLFIGAQAALGILPVCLALLFPVLLGKGAAFFSTAVIGLIFSGLSFIVGLAGGSHFALAVATMAVSGDSLEQIGGRFYALDLSGAAGAVLIAAGIFIPIYGIMNTLYFLSAASGISLVTLFRRAR